MMMKLAQTLQPITQAPQVAPTIAFNAGQPMASTMQQQFMSSPFDDMKMKRATPSSSAPNIYGGQGPANIVPDAQGNVGANPNAMANPNGITNPMFQTPGMDQIAQLLRGGQ